MAPEYARLGRFSVKSDVFSFGVLILEIVSGQKNGGFHNLENVEHLPSSVRFQTFHYLLSLSLKLLRLGHQSLLVYMKHKLKFLGNILFSKIDKFVAGMEKLEERDSH